VTLAWVTPQTGKNQGRGWREASERRDDWRSRGPIRVVQGIDGRD